MNSELFEEHAHNLFLLAGQRKPHPSREQQRESLHPIYRQFTYFNFDTIRYSFNAKDGECEHEHIVSHKRGVLHTGWYSTFSMPACCSSFETSSLTAGEVMNVGLSKTWLIWWQSIVCRLTTCFDGDSLRALHGRCILVLGLSLLVKALNLLAELLCSNLATNYSRFVFCLLGDCCFDFDKNSCLVIILSWLCFRIRCIIGSFLS